MKHKLILLLMICSAAVHGQCKKLHIVMKPPRGVVEFYLRSGQHTFPSSGGTLDIDSVKMSVCKNDELFTCSFVNSVYLKLYTIPDALRGEKSIQQFCSLSGTYSLKDKKNINVDEGEK